MTPAAGPEQLLGRAIVDNWPAPLRIHRAHSHLFGSAQFDKRSGIDHRFSTIAVRGSVVPVLYGGETDEATASETIFHTVDTPDGQHRPRRVSLSKYASWQWSEVVTTRDLALIRLAKGGLEALGATRAELILGGRESYQRTRAWAQSLAAAVPEADGMWWESRQSPGRWAVILFGPLTGRGGGVAQGELTADGPALPFRSAAGLARLDEIADSLEITVVRD